MFRPITTWITFIAIILTSPMYGAATAAGDAKRFSIRSLNPEGFYTIDARPTDTAAYLKEQLAKRIGSGTQPQNINVIYRGQRMADTETLREVIDQGEENTLISVIDARPLVRSGTATAAEKTEILIRIRSFPGMKGTSSANIRVPLNGTIGSLKELVAEEYHLPANQLIVKDTTYQILADSDTIRQHQATFEDFGIHITRGAASATPAPHITIHANGHHHAVKGIYLRPDLVEEIRQQVAKEVGAVHSVTLTIHYPH